MNKHAHCQPRGARCQCGLDPTVNIDMAWQRDLQVAAPRGVDQDHCYAIHLLKQGKLSDLRYPDLFQYPSHLLMSGSRQGGVSISLFKQKSGSVLLPSTEVHSPPAARSLGKNSSPPAVAFPAPALILEVILGPPLPIRSHLATHMED